MASKKSKIKPARQRYWAEDRLKKNKARRKLKQERKLKRLKEKRERGNVE